MIYVVTTVFLFLVEMLCWGVRVWWIRDHTTAPMFVHPSGRTIDRADTGKFTKAGRTRVKSMLAWWKESRWTDHVDVLLKVGELGNSVW